MKPNCRHLLFTVMDYRLRMKLLSGAEISGPMLSVLEKVGIIAVFLFE